MTNKQRALARVAGFLLVCTVTPVAVIALLNKLAETYTTGQIIAGFGLTMMTITLVSLCKMLYEIELSKLETLSQLKGSK
jgi:hypothetical protein